MDKISKSKRSKNMAAIRSKNTTLELLLRSYLFKAGYRYRIHYKIKRFLFDIVFPTKKKVININGCFWHQHKNCTEGRIPKSNQKYWINKFTLNVKRDRKKRKILNKLAWSFLEIWECELEKNIDQVITRCFNFLK